MIAINSVQIRALRSILEQARDEIRQLHQTNHPECSEVGDLGDALGPNTCPTWGTLDALTAGLSILNGLQANCLPGHVVEIGDLQRPDGEPPLAGLVIRTTREALLAFKRNLFADVTITIQEPRP